MAKQMYIGVNGVARKVKSIYIGVNGVARKIVNGYIGDGSGICRSFFQNNEYNFNYTGAVEQFTAPKTGLYKLEAWGAQGGNANGFEHETSRPQRLIYGGYGGYSVGTVFLIEGETIFVVVGQQGGNTTNRRTESYNGGGGCQTSSYGEMGGGGGATHIAKVTGLLKNLSSNVQNILIVAGGGGGAVVYNPQYYGESGCCTGCSGGGYQGSYMTKGNNAGTQTSGYAFGLGGSTSGTSGYSAGGGGGFYGGQGGYGEYGSYTAGGGSGYIANPLLNNKKMCVCPTDNDFAFTYYEGTGPMTYEHPVSNTLETKTVLVSNHSENAISEYAKEGNGSARITYIGEFDSNLSISGNINDITIYYTLPEGNWTIGGIVYSTSSDEFNDILDGEYVEITGSPQSITLGEP